MIGTINVYLSTINYKNKRKFYTMGNLCVKDNHDKHEEIIAGEPINEFTKYPITPQPLFSNFDISNSYIVPSELLNDLEWELPLVIFLLIIDCK